MFNVRTVEKFRRKGLAKVTAELQLRELTPRMRNAVIRALKNGFYPAGSGLGVELYEGMATAAGLPCMHAQKRQRYGWYVGLRNIPETCRRALADIQEADITANKLQGDKRSYWHRAYDGSKGDGWLHLHHIKDLDQLSEIAHRYANQPAYQDSVAPLIHAVKFGQTVKIVVH